MSDEERLDIEFEVRVIADDIDRTITKVAGLRREVDNLGPSFEKSLDRSERSLLKVKNDLTGTTGATTAATKSAADFAKANEVAAKAAKESGDALITQRYALYDVASTAAIAGVAILGLVGAYEAVAIARERAFADVRRTSGFDEDSGQIGDLEALRDELEDLTTTIPKSFTELAQTATVGGQLGVAAEDIGEYTESITKFSTVTGIAAEDSGLRLGKLVNILGLGTDGYQELAESIAFAGVKSAATEDQILSVAAEIGPYARAVGFAADETIGLATALASLQIAPEKARSAFQEFIRVVDGSITTGGERMRNFANLAGISADEFATAWQERPAEVFQAIANGLGQTGNTSEALRVLGLDGSRVGQVMVSLAQNTGLVSQAFADAKEGAENGFLDEAFAVTVDTVAEKLQLLVNSLANLADSIGGPTLAALGAVVSLLADFLNAAAAVADSPIGQAITFIVTPALILVGVLVTLIGAAALTGATFLALRTAVGAFSGQLVGAQLAVAQFIGGMVGVNVAAKAVQPELVAVGVAGQAAATGTRAAAVGANVAKVAFRGLAASTGIGIVLALAGWAFEAATAQEDLADATEDTIQPLEDQAAAALADSAAISEAIDSVTGLVAANSGLEGSLFSLGESLRDNGTEFSAYSTNGRKNIDALLDTINAMKRAATSSDGSINPQGFANLLAGLAQQLAEVGASSEAIAIVNSVLESTGVAAQKAAITSNGLAVGFNNVEESAKDAAKELRTVADYADDLDRIFSRSYELQFGAGAAYDAITEKVLDMRKASEDAAEDVADLNIEIQKIRATMAGLASERSGQEYFLSIALLYGDQLRAAAIGAEIARIDAEQAANKQELADKNTELTEAQDVVNKSLVGNSEAAIAARGNVRDLIQAYQDYIVELANSGLSQEELAAKVGVLKGEFVAQLEQMGYSRTEVDKYAGAFDGLATIINEFPRVVDMEVSLDPARQAIAEFLAENADKSIDIPVRSDPNIAAEQGKDAIDNFTNAVESNAAKSWTGGGGKRKPGKETDFWSNFWALFVGNSGGGSGISLMGTGQGFADGGFTGDGAKYDVAGLVHRGEYVMPKEAVDYYGVDRLATMHSRAVRGYAGGGLGGYGSGTPFMGMGDGGPIDLSQRTIEAIADALSERPAIMVADGKVLAQTTAAGHAATARSI